MRNNPPQTPISVDALTFVITICLRQLLPAKFYRSPSPPRVPPDSLAASLSLRCELRPAAKALQANAAGAQHRVAASVLLRHVGQYVGEILEREQISFIFSIFFTMIMEEKWDSEHVRVQTRVRFKHIKRVHGRNKTIRCWIPLLL